MKTAVLLGYPLAHSVTPSMYAAAFEAMGIEAQCLKWVTPPPDLKAAVQRLRGSGILGANVTVPHKEAVIPLIDDVDEAAKTIGAVNCIVRLQEGRLKGYNTDKDGFLRSLREAGFEPAGQRAVILGAGGAARAVVAGLVDSGTASLTVVNRDLSRATRLAADFGNHAPIRAIGWQDAELDRALGAAGLIVNTTPIGTAHTESSEESPLDKGRFRAGVYVYDLVYNPAETPFLRLARLAGAIPVSGLEMLVYQGAESIRLWTGHEPLVDIMREAARAALGQAATAVNPVVEA